MAHGELLCHVSDGPMVGNIQLAGIWRHCAKQELKQGRLADAVAPDDADLLASMHGAAQIDEYLPRSTLQGDVVSD